MFTLNPVAFSLEEFDVFHETTHNEAILLSAGDQAAAADLILTAARAFLLKMPYSDYLKTEWWLSLRRYALERSGLRCQLCNTADQTLDVHHRTYERRGQERPDDLTVLCRPCHAKFHDKLP